jgi:UDP-N-acetylglucosamine--N-acetylmuramyl-(pentapeptide) pyrophosphoryl-undecaprenol N-acetylglucosamine transferase
MDTSKKVKAPTICFVAGRSGGHLVPCLTQAAQIRQSSAEQTKIMLFSTDAALDKKIVSDYPWVDRYIPLRLDNIPYRKFWLWPLFILQLLNSLCTSFIELRKAQPSKVVSMGGFTTLPVCLAARILGIPIELYELNVVPGKAVTLLAPRAHVINIVFPETAFYFKQPTTLVPYPIRFPESARHVSAADARTKIGLAADKKTVLILGGSQGSVFINSVMKKWIEQLPATQLNDLQVIHQTGHHDTTNWKALYAQHAIPALIFDFNTTIELCYRAADLIVCRAGAGTLFEVLFFGKQCITIPLETNTTLHQKDNACAMSTQHPELFTMLEQKAVAKDPQVLFTMMDQKLW